MRRLVIALGDQLDARASAFDGVDTAVDAVWMAEVAGESTHVWSSKPRTALFLSAMRHFAEDLRAAGHTVRCVRLDDAATRDSLAAQLDADITRLRPESLVMTAPGDWRVLQVRNVGRLDDDERTAVSEGAGAIRRGEIAAPAGNPHGRSGREPERV